MRSVMIVKKRTVFKRCFLAFLVVFFSLGLVPAQAVEFDLSLGKVSLHYTQHNPIEIGVRGGRQGMTATRFSTEKYLNQTEIGSPGNNFDFSIEGLAELFELNANVRDGGLNSSTRWSNGEANLSAHGKDVTISYSVDRSSEGGADSKQVEVMIQADAKEGILSVNYDENENTITIPSDEETISRRMGISRLEARNLLDANGSSRVFEALNRADRSNPNGNNMLNNGDNEVAGGAGGIAGPGSVWLKDLDPQSTFSFYLQGPNFKARIQNSTLEMKLFYPGNGTQIKGVGANITIVGPITGNGKKPKRVVLMDSILYDEDKGYYSFSFEDASWLVKKQNLEPGGYDLYVDIGPSLTMRFGITITKDQKVVEGRY